MEAEIKVDVAEVASGIFCGASFPVSRIAIIDDAYDTPTKEVLLPFISDFLSAVGKSPSAIDSWKQNIFPVEDDFDEIDDIDDDIVAKLWNMRNDEADLAAIARSYLFGDSFAKISEIEPLIEFLGREVKGCEVFTYGSDTTPEKICEAEVVFIDYFLNVGESAEQAVARAESLAREIFASKHKKPLFLLMSRDNVTDEKIASFITKAELVGGMFYFISKQDFLDDLKLYLKLKNIEKALPHCYRIQSFVDSITKSIDKVTKQFKDDIKRLSLEDYVHIQKLSLHDDGHPLGDYMLWLFSSYFGHLLFECSSDVCKAQRALDGVNFQDDMIHQIVPSGNVFEFHNSAMMRTVENIVPYPEAESPVPEEAFLDLGDLFINAAEKKTLLVISAQCDLASQRRSYKPERQVLLIPGSLRSIHEKFTTEERGNPITQVFGYQGRKYRILWDTKQVMSLEYATLANWMAGKGYHREYRLRLPYALEIQHAFTSDVNRVGVPVMPPVDIPAIAIVHCLDRNLKPRVLYESREGDVYVSARRIGADQKSDSVLQFTEYFVFRLIERLKETVMEFGEVIGGRPQNGERRTKLGLYMQEIEKLLGSLGTFEDFYRPIPINTRELPVSKIRFFRGKETIDRNSVGKNVCIQILTDI